MDSPYASITFLIGLSFCFFLCWLLARHFFTRSLYETIPGPQPSSLLGYLPDLHDRHRGLNFHLTLLERFGHVARLKGGVLAADALYITDPLALRTILIKEQENFRESNEFAGLFGIVHRGDGLASVWGAEHRKQRKLINPVFNAGNVSKLLPLFWDIADQLRTRIIREIESTDERTCATEAHIDVLDHFTRAALEFVGSGGIGHTFQMLDSGNSPFMDFYDALKNVLPLASSLFLVLPFFNSWRSIRPVWLRQSLAAAVDYLPWPSARKFKAAVDTMHPVYDHILERGKGLLQAGGDLRVGVKDLTTLLIHANAEADEEDRMSDQVIKANISSIVHGGQETTSSILARFIHVLSIDQQLQRRMRNEILEAIMAKNGERLNYAELDSLLLLDAVCREVFRIYSPVTFVWRQTVEDTVVPLQFPLSHDASRSLLIKKGTSIYLGLSAANRSKAIWGDDANTFNIDRWLGMRDSQVGADDYEVPKTVYSSGEKETPKLPGIYSNIMTFLAGGRACPGMRFAVLEIKVILFTMLSSFSFTKAGTDEIDWQLGITLTPYVKGKESDGAKVPVTVSVLKKDCSA